GRSNAPATTAPLTWERYLSLPTVSAFAWAPKGTQLAYISNPKGTSAIFIVDAVEGGAPRRLAEGTAPVWSPDGTNIAYVAEGDIWVVPTSGGPPLRVTNDKEDERAVTWSSDGSQLAFMSTRSGFQDVWV